MLLQTLPTAGLVICLECTMLTGECAKYCNPDQGDPNYENMKSKYHGRQKCLLNIDLTGTNYCFGNCEARDIFKSFNQNESLDKALPQL